MRRKHVEVTRKLKTSLVSRLCVLQGSRLGVRALFFDGNSAENNVRKRYKRLNLARKGFNTRSVYSCHHSQLVTVVPHDLMDRRDEPNRSCGDAV